MRFKNVEEKQLNKKQTESPSKLKIIPLGGLEQIGLNITAFEYEDSIIVVDCGLILLRLPRIQYHPAYFQKLLLLHPVLYRLIQYGKRFRPRHFL